MLAQRGDCDKPVTTTVAQERCMDERKLTSTSEISNLHIVYVSRAYMEPYVVVLSSDYLLYLSDQVVTQAKLC